MLTAPVLATVRIVFRLLGQIVAILVCHVCLA